jgi:hypothetical protein
MPAGSLVLNLDKALATEGHMQPLELQWLATRAQKRRSIIEWGSYLGRSTIAMAQNTTGHVWALDDFQGPREDGVNTNLGVGRIDPDVPLTPDEVWRLFRENTQDIPNITAIQFDHRNWSILPLMGDMVFIDGSHQEAHVRQDLFRFLHLPAELVLLCGHDIDFAPVKAAVEHLLPDYRVAPGTTIWYRPWHER